MRNKQRQKKNRISLNLLFSGVTFLILLAVGLFVLLLTYILYQTGVIDALLDGFLNRTILFLLILAVFFIIGAVITLLLGRWLMGPMNEIIDATNELANGNYKVRLNFKGLISKHPTFIEFTDAFNKMADELDHTEIMSTDFVNNFSHEIKTPIASISGFAKLLKNENLTEEQRDEYATIIEEESLRLSQVASNTLMLAKIENQGILTDVVYYNVSEQIRGVILLLEKKWNEKNLELGLEFDEVYMHANSDMLKEVWLNILDNAIKFANENGKITVDIKRIENTIKVDISNTGSYISVSDRKRIFNKFYQGDTSRSSKGNGIGLAIVKDIIDLHNGTIDVECDDGLTIFRIELPYKPVQY